MREKKLRLGLFFISLGILISGIMFLISWIDLLQ